MPFPIAAAIGAASGVGSALVGKHSNNNALKAQTQATNRALAVEQENEAYRRAEARRIEDLQRAQFEAEQARLEPYRQARQQFLNQQGGRLGLNVGAPPPRPQFVPGQPQSPTAGPTGGVPLSALAAMQGTGTQNTQLPQLSLQEIMNWGSQYGQRG
jgi:hypothetical protein